MGPCSSKFWWWRSSVAPLVYSVSLLASLWLRTPNSLDDAPSPPDTKAQRPGPKHESGRWHDEKLLTHLTHARVTDGTVRAFGAAAADASITLRNGRSVRANTKVHPPACGKPPWSCLPG